jgi:hypothetical protein
VQDPARVGFVTQADWSQPYPWYSRPSARHPLTSFRFQNVTTACDSSGALIQQLQAVAASAARDDVEGDCFLEPDRGASYRGDAAVSVSGRPCVGWGSSDVVNGANILSDSVLPDLYASLFYTCRRFTKVTMVKKRACMRHT